LRYPPDPPTVEEIIAVMRPAGDRPDGLRLRGVIVVPGRAGLRISEAVALAESDLDQARRRALLCVPRTRGRPCSPAGIQTLMRNAAVAAGVSRGFAPGQLRDAHAVEMSREGVPLVVIQRQLGHADLGITSSYLRGIDNTEIIHAVHGRRAPMIRATTGLSLAA
jgi:integrase/recombinase XerD